MFFTHCKQFGVSGHTQYCSDFLLPGSVFVGGQEILADAITFVLSLDLFIHFDFEFIIFLVNIFGYIPARIHLNLKFFKKNTFQVTMFHVFWYYVGRLGFCLVISICGNPKTLYGQDLAFRLEGKCKAAIQNRKKIAKPTVGFHFIFSILLAAFIITVAKL